MTNVSRRREPLRAGEVVHVDLNDRLGYLYRAVDKNVRNG
jgi:hypothetical protein